MATFCDRNGKQWVIDITVGSISRVRKSTGVEIGKLLTDQLKPLGELLENPEVFMSVVYELLVDRGDTTAEEFADAMSGDELDAAQTAFLDALTDFTPSRQRETVRTLIGKIRQLADSLTAQSKTNVDNLDVSTLIDTVLNSPGSSESSRGPIRSVN